mmetsp:Transcript_27799/g.70223  ORF Transcript_27799/g.70223 Transcript_27799/m.70223 type:complete len:242 (-) Transcript_27799:593-1318(-)
MFGSVDYHKAGVDLLRHAGPRRYNELDAVYEHPTSKGKVYIGNLVSAQNKGILDRHSIKRIVNCQDTTTENFHEGQAGYQYYRFPISHWWREKNMDSPENVLRFFLEPFKWIDAQIEQGHSVLIHCLAGAHRAGSTGVAYCMYANKSGFDETLAIVKSIRPIVDPFGPLEELLRRLEAGLKKGAVVKKPTRLLADVGLSPLTSPLSPGGGLAGKPRASLGLRSNLQRVSNGGENPTKKPTS